jgi:hypothetical protein
MFIYLLSALFIYVFICPSILFIYLYVYLSTCLFVYLSTYLSVYDYSPLLNLGCILNFLILYTVGRLLGRGISQSQGRYLHTWQHKQNKYTHTSVTQMGFEPTMPLFQRVKTVCVLDRSAAVIGRWQIYWTSFIVSIVILNFFSETVHTLRQLWPKYDRLWPFSYSQLKKTALPYLWFWICFILKCHPGF